MEQHLRTPHILFGQKDGHWIPILRLSSREQAALAICDAKRRGEHVIWMSEIATSNVSDVRAELIASAEGAKRKPPTGAFGKGSSRTNG